MEPGGVRIQLAARGSSLETCSVDADSGFGRYGRVRTALRLATKPVSRFRQVSPVLRETHVTMPNGDFQVAP